MFGLDKRENKYFRISLLGHVFLGFGIFIFSFLPSCEEEPEQIHVFELAASAPVPPSETKKVKVNQVPPKPSTPAPPKVEQKKPPTPPPVKPQKNIPKPTPPAPKTKPKPKQTVQTQTKPKSISFEEFRKSQNLPRPTTKTKIKPASIEPIKLNPQDFQLPEIKVASSKNQNQGISPNMVNQYLAAVKAKLEQTWRQLLSESSLSAGGEARLSFRISSTGTLISVKLSKSSGNPTLDRLVLAVAQRSGSVGRPPGGRLDSVLEIPFRVQ